jgi:hypothetical protein
MLEELKSYGDLVRVGQSVWARMFTFFKTTATMTTTMAATMLPVWVQSKVDRTLRLVVQETAILLQ